MSRLAALVILVALTGCGAAPVEPGGVEITYLEPIPDHTPPTLRGKIVNETGTALRVVEYDLFYDAEMAPLVLRDVPARGFREFDVPLPEMKRLPTAWRAEFVRAEWAGGAAPSPSP